MSRKSIKTKLLLILLAIVIIPAGYILVVRLEGTPPQIDFSMASQFLGLDQELTFAVADPKSGLRHFWAGVHKDGKDVPLVERHFPSAGFFTGGKTLDAQVTQKVTPRQLGLSDGKATLRIMARDYSWRSWLHGNKTYIEHEIEIDTRRPAVDVLTRMHNINQGGAGLVIYRISEPCQSSGVYVGERFFPGRSGQFENERVLMALFALGYTQSTGTDIYISAVDQAGNRTRAGFPKYIRKKRFRTDKINISDRFLNTKMPEFDLVIDNAGENPLLNKFLHINRELRKASTAKVMEIAAKSENEIYWKGAFLRLPNSKRMAGFADFRTYFYKGQPIDKQVHLGIDLAGYGNDTIPAANHGKVLFAGPIGIYGRTVIIDHGFGLLSMYSHLNQINVSEQQMVAKKEPIGTTGATGMAGGDHLHFSIIVHNTYANPIEWWDPSWIKNNITTKIETVHTMVP